MGPKCDSKPQWNDVYIQILTSKGRKNPQKLLHLAWPETRTISSMKEFQVDRLKDK